MSANVDEIRKSQTKEWVKDLIDNKNDFLSKKIEYVKKKAEFSEDAAKFVESRIKLPDKVNLTSKMYND